MKIVKKYCLALLPDWDHSCTSKTFMILFAIWQWRRKTKQSTFLTFETNQLNGGLCRGEVKGEGGDQSVKTNFKLLIGLNFSPADIIYLPLIESLQKIRFCELLHLPLSPCLFLLLFCGWDKAMIHSSAFFGAGAVWELPDLFIPTKTKGSTLKRNSQSLNVQIKTM